MDAKRIRKLRREMDDMRRSPQKARDLERLASKLGRKVVSARGKHPMWMSQSFDHLSPLSIPHHGGRDLSNGTKNSILNQLEDDLLSWEERLEEEEDG